MNAESVVTRRHAALGGLGDLTRRYASQIGITIAFLLLWATFIVLARSQKKPSKKARQRAAKSGKPARKPVSPRWRSSGLVRKDVLEQALISNGAQPTSDE